MKKKSLIIGFGDRAKEVVLPALVLSKHEIFIYSRNLNKLKNYKNYFNFNIIEELNKQNLNQIDQIFLCTKNDVYENIIKEIINTNLSHEITLFIDTPLLYHYYSIKKYVANFKNIFISEDEFFDPIIFVIKRLLNENSYHELYKINLNYYGYILHSISQITSILNLKQNKIEENITYGLFLNLKKIKYLLKIRGVKIFFNFNRDWFSDKSNIEIFLKKNNNNNFNKKFKIEYIFKKNEFKGFQVNNNKYETKYFDEIKDKINFFLKNSRYYTSRKHQIKILSFYNMINFYENERDSNFDDYIQCEYFGSLTNNLRIFLNLNFNLIKLRKFFYKLKMRI